MTNIRTSLYYFCNSSKSKIIGKKIEDYFLNLLEIQVSDIQAALSLATWRDLEEVGLLSKNRP